MIVVIVSYRFPSCSKILWKNTLVVYVVEFCVWSGLTTTVNLIITSHVKNNKNQRKNIKGNLMIAKWKFFNDFVELMAYFYHEYKSMDFTNSPLFKNISCPKQY